MWKITVDPRLKQFKIVVTGKAISWESVPQGNGSWEDYQRNTK